MRLRHICPALLALTAMTSLFVGEAAAQDKATIDVLAFDTFDTSDEVMDIFYSSLNRGIAAHSDMEVVDGASVTLADMLLTLGCSEGVEQCLPTLSGVLPVNRVVFGSVQRSENIYLFTIKMYNLDAGAYTHVIEDQTVQGDIDRLKMVVPTIIDSMLYGPVGKLRVNITGASEAEVFFDGRQLGVAPKEFGDLPLGEHVVTVRTDGQEESRTVVLKRGEPSSLDVRFDGGIDEPGAVSGGGSPFTVPAYAALGVGAAGVVVGVLGQVQLGSQEEEAERLYGGRESVLQSEQADVVELRSGMNGSYTQMMVGYSVGAAGLLGGAALLFLSSRDSQTTVGVSPMRGGGVVTFGGSF